MTTYIPFSYPPNSAFTTQITLDGNLYSLVVNWGLFGQRSYVNLFDQSGNRIFTTALIGSPDPVAISSLSWDDTTQLVTVVTAAAHGVPIATLSALTISGATPTTYNGLWLMTSQNATTLTFPLATDPGVATLDGAVGVNINLVAGYGFSSTLVFRESSQNFEVNP